MNGIGFFKYFLCINDYNHVNFLPLTCRYSRLTLYSLNAETALYAQNKSHLVLMNNYFYTLLVLLRILCEFSERVWSVLFFLRIFESVLFWGYVCITACVGTDSLAFIFLRGFWQIKVFFLYIQQSRLLKSSKFGAFYLEDL